MACQSFAREPCEWQAAHAEVVAAEAGECLKWLDMFRCLKSQLGGSQPSGSFCFCAFLVFWGFPCDPLKVELLAGDLRAGTELTITRLGGVVLEDRVYVSWWQKFRC